MSDRILLSVLDLLLDGAVILLWLKLTVLLCTGLLLAKTTSKLLHRRFVLRATLASAFAIPLLHALWQSAEDFALNIEVPQPLTWAADASQADAANLLTSDRNSTMTPPIEAPSGDTEIPTELTDRQFSSNNAVRAAVSSTPETNAVSSSATKVAQDVLVDLPSHSGGMFQSPWLSSKLIDTSFYRSHHHSNWYYQHKLAILWIAISTILLVKLLADLYSTKCLILQSTDAPEQWKIILHEAKPSYLDASPLSLKLNPFISSPCVAGHFSPVILLPCSVENSEIAQTLRHELTHIEHSDWKWNVTCQMAKAVFWPLPWIHSIQSELRKLSEDICDDTVLISGHSAEHYANQLIRIAEKSTTDPDRRFVIPMATSSSHLKRRIERIVQFNGKSLQRIGKPLLLGTTATSCLITCVLSAIAIKTVQGDQETIAVGSTQSQVQKLLIEPGIGENGERILNVLLHGRATHAGQTPCSDVLVQVKQFAEGTLSPSVATKLASSITNASGEFNLEFPIPRDRSFNIALTASKKGFVAQTHTWPSRVSDGATAEEPIFEMVPEQPFRLKILEPTGTPHLNAKLRVSAVWLPEKAEAASNWHLMIKKEAKSIPSSAILNFPNRIFTFHMGIDGVNSNGTHQFTLPKFPTVGCSVVHDDDLFPVENSGIGEYQISGLMKNSVVLFELSGPNLQHQMFACFISEDNSSTKSTTATLLKDYATSPPLIDGNSPIQTEVSVPLSGRLLDFENGSPIANASLRITNRYADGSNSYFSRFQPQATTDKQGYFSIEGLRPRERERIEITPATNTPYVLSSLIFDLDQASQQTDWKISMERAIWLVGAVTDDSGVPLEANIFYLPDAKNPNLQKIEPEKVHSEWNKKRLFKSEPDGSFRIPVLPGEGILAGAPLSFEDRFKFEQTLPTNLEPENQNNASRRSGSRYAQSLNLQNLAQTAVAIEVKAGEETPRQNIIYKRLPTASIKLVDGPKEYTPIVVNLLSSGNTMEVRPNDDGTYTVPGLSDTHEQYVWLRGFGDLTKAKYLRLKGNTGSVTSVSLDSCCSLKGRTPDSQDQNDMNGIVYSVTPQVPGLDVEENLSRYPMKGGILEHWITPGLVHKIKIYREEVEIYQFDVESVAGKNYEVDFAPIQPTVRELP